MDWAGAAAEPPPHIGESRKRRHVPSSVFRKQCFLLYKDATSQGTSSETLGAGSYLNTGGGGDGVGGGGEGGGGGLGGGGDTATTESTASTTLLRQNRTPPYLMFNAGQCAGPWACAPNVGVLPN